MSLKKHANFVLKIPARIVLLTIKYLYQKVISPMTPNVCIYRPTCSSYMIEAIERFGLIRGGMKGTWRILRCHPFAKGGYDPVVPDEEE